MGNSATVMRLEQYYGHTLKIDGLSYKQWTAQFLNMYYNKLYMYNVPITFSAVPGKYIVFADSMHTSGSKFYSNIYVFVNQNTVLNLFSSIKNIDTGWLYICDDKGNVITQSKDLKSDTVGLISTCISSTNGYFTQKINGKDMFITYVKGGRNNFTYVSAVSLASIQDKVKNIKILLGFIIAGSFLAGFLILLVVAYKSSKPIRKLVGVLSQNAGNSGVGYDFNFINTEVANIMNSNQALKQELLEQLPFQSISIFHRLLSGEIKEEKENQAGY